MSLSRDIQIIFDDIEKAQENFFEDDDFFKTNSMLKNSSSLFKNDTSLFNSNSRERDSIEFGKFPDSFRGRLPANESFGELVPMSFPSLPGNFSPSDFSWNDDKTEWAKEIQLNSQHTYSNINVNVKNNILMIGAAEEQINEQVCEKIYPNQRWFTYLGDRNNFGKLKLVYHLLQNLFWVFVSIGFLWTPSLMERVWFASN